MPLPLKPTVFSILFTLGLFFGNAVVLAQEIAPNPTAINIQRTMKALTESTAENPAHIRVLFYGQSIVAQGWTGLIEDYLRETYPTVDFEFCNNAIGGYTSERLVRTAESDLYPWYPDLLFFHVYGPMDKYEEIVRKTRERTSADIILWTSHLSGNDEAQEMLKERDQRSKDILAIAQRHHCTVVDLNLQWAKLLAEHQWKTSQLLADVVHLNPEGCYYYSEFVKQALVRLPNTPGESPYSGRITEYPIDSDSFQKDGNDYQFSFDGNRVVAVVDTNATEGTEVEILLDGKPVRDYKEMWAVTRTENSPCWMPPINAVFWNNPPLEETWQLKALDGSKEDGSFIRFAVEGSLTGPDGEGTSDQRFVSNSGRVVIEQEDFAVTGHFVYFQSPLPENYHIDWKTYPLSTSRYLPKEAKERTVLVQNCSNGPHTLTMKTNSGTLGMSKLIVYKPATVEE